MFENFGIGLARGIVLSAVSPHPGPLPWGEGEPFTAWRTIHTRRLSTAQCSPFPLPGREGQGEGKEAAAPRHANDLAWACKDCPEGHIQNCRDS